MDVPEHCATRRVLGRPDRRDRTRPAIEANPVTPIRRSVLTVTFLGSQIEESLAVAIDGEIFQDAYLAPLNPESEIYLIPKIGGG